MRSGILLVTHGTIERLSDMTAFVTNIRRGHPPPPSLIEELLRRYNAIGGSSPLTSISRELARKVEERTGHVTRLASRLWEPYPKAVLAEMQAAGVSRVAEVALAQYSTHIYKECVEQAVAELAAEGSKERLDVRYASNWGLHPALVDGFAERIAPMLRAAEARGKTELLFSAHSLPLFILRGGDPYEDEVQKSAAAIAEKLGASHSVAFQSQGATTGPRGVPVEWLGPDLQSALRAAKERGTQELVIAPIGFLADHVEILYDIDIEAKGWATELGIHLSRTPSLNADETMVSVVADLAATLLQGAPAA